MVAPAVEGIDLFKIAGRSISGWIPSLKTGAAVRQPFCSQIEERLNAHDWRQLLIFQGNPCSLRRAFTSRLKRKKAKESHLSRPGCVG